MPFKFAHICNLLSSLEDIETRQPPFLPKVKQEESRKVIRTWFKTHRRTIDSPETDDVALLSTLFPEKRTDRVYSIREPRLARILGRCLGLGTSRLKDLMTWQKQGNGDLADCVERVMKQAENAPAMKEVTVEEIDLAMHRLAAASHFSGPGVRVTSSVSSSDPMAVLGPVINRLPSRDAKWLTRLILKDFATVLVPEYFTLRSFHFLLPELLDFQSTFDAAVGTLRGPVLDGYPACPDQESERLLRKHATSGLVPKIGVKVGRPRFEKARSISHCVNLVGKQCWSVERKYDGEYCQIHVDLSKDQPIQIFSKSGRDSANDRRTLHQALHESLSIGQPGCKIRFRCILEGEFLIYNLKRHCIDDFNKIRKHVSRSGTFLGTELDSPPQDYETPMIMFFDLLLLDDESMMTKPYLERRRVLKNVAKRVHTKAYFAEREIIDFSLPKAEQKLRKLFACSVTARAEGMILKPAREPYLSIQPAGESRSFSIKLKTDYIKGLGDAADFAIIGGKYVATEAHRLGLKNTRWTTFVVGCLENKERVQRFDERPVFRVISEVNWCIGKSDLQALSNLGHVLGTPYQANSMPGQFDLRMGNEEAVKGMSVTFSTPFVFEIVGSAFEKAANTNFYTLRHPRVIKVHWDRSFKETVSFDELQEMAYKSRAAPDRPSQEEAAWIKKLELAGLSKAMKQRLDRGARSPSSTRDSSTTSPAKTRSSATVSPSQIRARCITMAETSHTRHSPLPSATTAPTPVDKENHKQSSVANRKRKSDETSEEQDVFPSSKMAKFTQPLVEIINESPFKPHAPERDESRRAPSMGQHPLTCPQTQSSIRLPTLSTCEFYLCPCIASMPYIIEDLLPRHGATPVYSLQHWKRQQSSPPSNKATDSLHNSVSTAATNVTNMSLLPSTVAESCAYAGLQKCVLIESNRREASVKVVGSVRGLGLGESILVWDWRVLEGAGTQGQQTEACGLKNWLRGIVSGSDEGQRSEFHAANGFDWLAGSIDP